MFSGCFTGKRVLLTGHTGFKGAWLAEWLLLLGAEVHGFALDPDESQPLFDQLGLAARLASDTRGDVGDLKALQTLVRQCQPEIVLHLAAQPLVRRSFQTPVETFATNIMGTAHVLEALRSLTTPCTVVCVTTDKCYENREWLHAYREEDAMGGYDPYSASKGAAELVISSYRRSFFSRPESSLRLASARAGNVIGGGDWSPDRIVPDCMRALFAGEPIPVRNRHATRPWQHVLEPLSGYLWLAARLAAAPTATSNLASAFNFGPALAGNRTVLELVQEILRHTAGHWVDRSDPNAPHEAGKLNLATDKAFHLLGWRPVWDFSATIAATTDWYQRDAVGESAVDLTRRQIMDFCQSAADQGIPWAGDVQD